MLIKNEVFDGGDGSSFVRDLYVSGESKSISPLLQSTY
jgi:hypothetical protein